jgi:hypothetical protein
MTFPNRPMPSCPCNCHQVPLLLLLLPTSTWKFAFYQLDLAEAQNGRWVGLSELASLGAGRSFLVLEPDHQGGPDAAVKKLYEISLGDYRDSSSSRLVVVVKERHEWVWVYFWEICFTCLARRIGATLSNPHSSRVCLLVSLH